MSNFMQHCWLELLNNDIWIKWGMRNIKQLVNTQNIWIDAILKQAQRVSSSLHLLTTINYVVLISFLF